MHEPSGSEHSPANMDRGPGRVAPRRITTVKVRARGEDFRIVQLVGNLFVCTKQTGSCCCGWEEKGRMPFETALWSDEWERRRIRNQLHLTLSGCLGPCAAGNNALLQVFGRSIWLKDLNDPALVPAVFDYAQAMLAAGRVLSPPPALAEHVYERYLPPPEAAYEPLVEGESDDGGLDRLDPVCLMDVDPATARHRVEYNGRTIVFCAPSCKKQFLADPEAYLVA
jgi:YHS domain-containing protein